MKVIQTAFLVLICLCSSDVGRAAQRNYDEVQRELEYARAVLAKTTIDLSKAIVIAQEKVPTGKPIYAITEKGHGKLMYEVFFLVGDLVTEVKVDAITSEIVKIEKDEGDDIDHLSDAKKGLGLSKISFTEAIATALDKVEGGKPFKVEFEAKDGTIAIEVELVAGDKTVMVEIDPATGTVSMVEEKD